LAPFDSLIKTASQGLTVANIGFKKLMNISKVESIKFSCVCVCIKW
jgi:hypothetical protein